MKLRITVYVIVMLGIAALLLAQLGCTALMSQTPVTRILMVTESPDAVYQRALGAMARMGGEITATDAQSRMISARVHNAVILNVTVTPTSGGALLQATAVKLPNKIAVGTMDEADTYISKMR